MISKYYLRNIYTHNIYAISTHYLRRWTMDMFTARLVTFLLGLLISNIHVALLYCDTDVKQVRTK